MIRLIKVFQFTDVERPDMVLSDSSKIRVNTEDTLDRVLQLKLNSSEYPTDTDIFAKTIITTPNSVKQWQAFEVIGDFPENTSAKYRFFNGTREIYWDGANWVTAIATDWNTELEIQTNISTFPFDNKSIGVVVNLLTTDISATPKIKEIKMLGLFDFDVYQDVFETLMQKIHDFVRPVTDVLTDVVATTSSFDFSSANYNLQNKGYNIVGVEAIYNVTDDPLEVTNLLDSYTPGAVNSDGETNAPGTATTTVPITAGKMVRFKLKYVPEVAVHTDEDFYEVGKVPSIVFETIEEIERRDGLSVENTDDASGGDSIRDIPNKTAVTVLPPAHIDLRFEYAMFTDLAMDQTRLAAEMNKLIQENKQFKSLALDEPLSLDEVSRLKTMNIGSQGNLMTARGIFDVRNIPLFIRPAIEEALVTRVNVDITT